MATAQARIFKTTNPAGWTWTFDNTSTPDAAIDNVGSNVQAGAAGAAAALDAIKPLISALPGTLSSVVLNITTFEVTP